MELRDISPEKECPKNTVLASVQEIGSDTQERSRSTLRQRETPGENKLCESIDKLPK